MLGHDLFIGGYYVLAGGQGLFQEAQGRLDAADYFGDDVNVGVGKNLLRVGRDQGGVQVGVPGLVGIPDQDSLQRYRVADLAGNGTVSQEARCHAAADDAKSQETYVDFRRDGQR